MDNSVFTPEQNEILKNANSQPKSLGNTFSSATAKLIYLLEKAIRLGQQNQNEAYFTLMHESILSAGDLSENNKTIVGAYLLLLIENIHQEIKSLSPVRQQVYERGLLGLKRIMFSFLGSNFYEVDDSLKDRKSLLIGSLMLCEIDLNELAKND
ncbi:MAG: hypothetical protein ACRC8K_22825 [Waterburya sp.]